MPSAIAFLIQVTLSDIKNIQRRKREGRMFFVFSAACIACTTSCMLHNPRFAKNCRHPKFICGSGWLYNPHFSIVLPWVTWSAILHRWVFHVSLFLTCKFLLSDETDFSNRLHAVAHLFLPGFSLAADVSWCVRLTHWFYIKQR